MFWKSIISLEKRLEKFSKFAKKRSQTFHKVVKTIRKSFHKRSIMGQKDTFSQVKKNYFSLILKAFSLLAPGKCIASEECIVFRQETAGRKVHCGRRVHTLFWSEYTSIM